jgi:flagellar basal body-associated protein FliL
MRVWKITDPVDEFIIIIIIIIIVVVVVVVVVDVVVIFLTAKGFIAVAVVQYCSKTDTYKLHNHTK